MLTGANASITTGAKGSTSKSQIRRNYGRKNKKAGSRADANGRNLLKVVGGVSVWQHNRIMWMDLQNLHRSTESESREMTAYLQAEVDKYVKRIAGLIIAEADRRSPAHIGAPDPVAAGA